MANKRPNEDYKKNKKRDMEIKKEFWILMGVVLLLIVLLIIWLIIKL